MRKFEHKDSLSMGQLSCEDIELVLNAAEPLKEISKRDIKRVPSLRGKSIVNFFCEPSTRNRTSFEMTAKRLSAETGSLSASGRSMIKGESPVDSAGSGELIRRAKDEGIPVPQKRLPIISAWIIAQFWDMIQMQK